MANKAEARLSFSEKDHALPQEPLHVIENYAKLGFAEYQFFLGTLMLSEDKKVVTEQVFEREVSTAEALRWWERAAQQKHFQVLERWSEAFQNSWFGFDQDQEAAQACDPSEDSFDLQLCLSRISNSLGVLEKNQKRAQLPEGYCHGDLAEERILTSEDNEAGDRRHIDALKKCAEAGFSDYQWAWGQAILGEVYRVSGEYTFQEVYSESDGLRWLAESAKQGFLPALEFWSDALTWGWFKQERDPHTAAACMRTEDPMSQKQCLEQVWELLRRVESREQQIR